MIPVAILRAVRLLCLGTAFAASAAHADNYTDFVQANDRYAVLMLHAKPEQGLPQRSDPAVAPLLAIVTDGPRLFAQPAAPLASMQTSIGICTQVADYARYYQQAGFAGLSSLSGPALQQAQRAQVEQNLARYGDEMSALFGFVIDCNAHLVTLMDSERQAKPEEAATGAGKARLHDFSVNSARAYAGLVQFVAMPYWKVTQKKTMLDAAARHAAVNAAMMKPELRQALLASLAETEAGLDPSLAPSLATIRQALAVTGCAGLCEY